MNTDLPLSLTPGRLSCLPPARLISPALATLAQTSHPQAVFSFLRSASFGPAQGHFSVCNKHISDHLSLLSGVLFLHLSPLNSKTCPNAVPSAKLFCSSNNLWHPLLPPTYCLVSQILFVLPRYGLLGVRPPFPYPSQQHEACNLLGDCRAPLRTSCTFSPPTHTAPPPGS